MPQMLKKKIKTKSKSQEPIVKLGELADVTNSKDKDFDLDLDAARFNGKKGKPEPDKRAFHRNNSLLNRNHLISRGKLVINVKV